MSTATGAPPPPGIDGIIDAIRTAWYAGRRVVPLVGAGLSADSGIPVIASLYRYFGKFHQYLAGRVYLPGGPSDPIEPHAARFCEAPWEYVRTFGWPDRFDLNQDLLGALEQNLNQDLLGALEHDSPPEADPRPLVERAVERGYEAILDRTAPDAVWYFRQLRQAVGRLAAAAGAAGPGTAVACRFDRDEGGRYVPLSLFGDWRRVIQHFTHYQGEYADVLFHRLCGGRRPSLGHRSLAFLVKLLAIRAVFTFNFDELIEQALRSEQVDHQAFAMEHGGGLPHEALVQDVTAVVKMHGGTHALLLDQRLDHPLAGEYKGRFERLVGNSPLLLVVGCSGGDYRLVDLLDHMVRRDPGAQIAWVHFENSEPEFLGRLRRQYPGRPRAILAAPTCNPGQTLQHVYAALAGRHPAARAPYPAHVDRPFSFGGGPAGGPAEVGDIGESPFVVLTSPTADENAHPVRTAAEALVDLAAYWVRKGWRPIWVDLEGAHTLAAVAGSIVDQCRAIDTALAPSVIPVGDDAAVGVADIEVALHRVVAALRRSRYLVLLDGLEAYLWPPTAHHGETTGGRSATHLRLLRLLLFLVALRNDDRSIGESRVFLGVDRAKRRADGPTPAGDRYHGLVEDLIACGWSSIPVRPPAAGDSVVRFADNYLPPAAGAAPCRPLVTPNPSGPRYAELLALLPADERPHDPAAGWGVGLLVMSAVRRCRHLVTLRHLLRPLFGDGRAVDAALGEMTTGGLGQALGMTRLEGGGVWYHRPVRDWVYAENTRYAGTDALTRCLTGDPDRPGGRDEVRLAAAQLFAVAVAHQQVARLYYTHTFTPSDDAVTFVEYVYHRVSGVRYFAKLLALLGRRGEVREYGRLVAGGVADARDFLGRGLTDRGRDWWWSGFGTEGSFREIEGGGPVDPEVCERMLRRQHADEITALAQAWVRAEPVVRTQLPAEQLLHWCDALLGDDIPRRLNDVVLRDGGGERLHFGGPGGVNPDARRAVEALAEAVADFAVKLKFERADYDGAAADRWAVLKADRDWVDGGQQPDAPPRWAYLIPGRVDRPNRPTADDFLRLVRTSGEQGRVVPLASMLRPVHLHYLLDVVACFNKRDQDQRDDGGGARELLRVVNARLNQVAASNRGRSAAENWAEEIRDWPDEQVTVRGDLDEAVLRYHYLKAEVLFRDASVFAQDIGFVGRPPAEVPGVGHLRRRVELADDYVEQGLGLLRTRSPRADGRLRSLILDPAPGGAVHPPYRAALYALRGRAQWLQAVRDADTAADPDRLDAGFEVAFQSFDLALAGLRDANHQTAAQAELYRVEACLALARVKLHPRGAAVLQRGPAGAVNKAVAKHESARVGLQRARAHLMTGRRNVIWWKLFYALAAQYHADRLGVGLVLLLNDWPEPGGRVRPGEVLGRLRRGYAAVRAGLDLRQPVPDPGRRTDWPWLRRAWREMTLAGYGIGRVMLRHAVGRLEQHPPADYDPAAVLGRFRRPGEHHRYVCDTLRGFNAAARLLGPAPADTPEGEIHAVLSGSDPAGSLAALDAILGPALSIGVIDPAASPIVALGVRERLLVHTIEATQPTAGTPHRVSPRKYRRREPSAGDD